MFFFLGINLLDSMSNEVVSQGFVQFFIYLVVDIVDYIIICNWVGIYFDSNLFIIMFYVELQ